MTRYRERREAGDFLPENAQQQGGELEGLTKDQLIQRADDLGLDFNRHNTTKSGLIAAIEAAGG